jgi:4a-hydroxytetrahydrobiopterin dehydratase
MNLEPQTTNLSPMNAEMVQNALANLDPNWADIDELKINRTFEFENFQQSMDFVNQLATIAEQANHHPDIHIYFNKVVVELWSHDVQGLSPKDFELAAQIDALFSSQNP